MFPTIVVMGLASSKRGGAGYLRALVQEQRCVAVIKEHTLPVSCAGYVTGQPTDQQEPEDFDRQAQPSRRDGEHCTPPTE